MVSIELDELKIQLQELLDTEIVRLSNSPQRASILFGKKKNNTLKLCIDHK
jgi:hypothetical protein